MKFLLYCEDAAAARSGRHQANLTATGAEERVSSDESNDEEDEEGAAAGDGDADTNERELALSNRFAGLDDRD